MSAQQKTQWMREAGLVVFRGDTPDKGLDLSQFKFRFQTTQIDEETPNSCAIRVYNLSDPTVKKIREEYVRVLVKAGYINGQSGIVFSGTIRQFGIGRESAADSFLDILAADGDLPYGFGHVNFSLAAGPSSTMANAFLALAANSSEPVPIMPDLPIKLNGTETIRSKVYFGMMSDFVRDIADSNEASWSIQNGMLQMIPLDGYLPGQIVEVNSRSGMIGLPELTEQGISARVLINPSIRVGGLIRINNKDINQLVQKNETDPTKFNTFGGIQRLASVSADGLYRVYVVEHIGDTRGQEWYSNIIALAVENKRVAPFAINP